MSLDVNRESIEHIGQRVDNLVFAVLVLAGLLVAFLIVELGLLVFALFNKSSKKKKKGGDPDSVVVKSGKSKRSSKSKKKKRSSKSSVSKKKSEHPAKPTSAKLAAKKPGKSVKSQQKKESSSEQLAASSTPVRTPADVTSNGTATETLIAHIKPQFPDKHDAKDADTTTDQQIAEIPSQFESTKTAIQPKGPGVQDARLPDSVVAQIANRVYEYVTLAMCRPQELPTHMPVQQQAGPEAVLSNVPVQQVQQPLTPEAVLQQNLPPTAKPVQYQQYSQNAGRAPLESTYLDVGMNGESPNVVPQIKEIAQNSLMLNTAVTASPNGSNPASNAAAKPSN